MAHKLIGIAIVEVNTHVFGLRGKTEDGRYLYLDEFPGLKLRMENRLDEPGFGAQSVADAKACARRNNTTYLGLVR